MSAALKIDNNHHNTGLQHLNQVIAGQKIYHVH